MKLSKTEYNTMHVNRLRNYPKTKVCEFCGVTGKTHWSNKSGEYRSAFDEFDWQELCPPCHGIYDTRPHRLIIKQMPESVPLSSLPRYEGILYGAKATAWARVRSYEWFT